MGGNAGGAVQQLTAWSLEATPNSADPTIVARTFRVGFPSQQLSGTYTLTLASAILSAAGDALDENLDAGVDLLFNRVDPGGPTAPVAVVSADTPLAIPDDGRPLTSLIRMTRTLSSRTST